MITQDYLKEILNYDSLTGIFTWKVKLNRRIVVGSIAGHIKKDGYRYIVIHGKHYYNHRLAWFYVYGIWPAKELDHEDRNRLNNKINNLREATKVQNQHNRTKQINNTSGYKGVYWVKNAKKWRATINFNAKRRSLGYFETVEEAAKAYKDSALELHKDFARV